VRLLAAIGAVQRWQATECCGPGAPILAVERKERAATPWATATARIRLRRKESNVCHRIRSCPFGAVRYLSTLAHCGSININSWNFFAASRGFLALTSLGLAFMWGGIPAASVPLKCKKPSSPLDNNLNVLHPVLVRELADERIVAIAAGCAHFAALSAQGDIYTWYEIIPV
jgi:hypothetical protein